MMKAKVTRVDLLIAHIASDPNHSLTAVSSLIPADQIEAPAEVPPIIQMLTKRLVV